MLAPRTTGVPYPLCLAWLPSLESLPLVYLHSVEDKFLQDWGTGEFRIEQYAIQEIGKPHSPLFKKIGAKPI